MANLWVDVEDLFRYVQHNARPSGIQRVAIEICRSLRALDGAGARIRFVRHDTARATLVVVSFESLLASLALLDREAAVSPGGHAVSRQGPPPRSRLYRIARDLSRRLPDGTRTGLLGFYIDQRAAWGRLVLAARRPPPPPRTGDGGSRSYLANDGSFAREAAAGDVLLVLGAPWFPGHAERMLELVQTRGMRLAVLVHDLIPIRRPEWCERNLRQSFTEWLGTILPITDIPMAISRATAGDLESCAARGHFALRSAPSVIPLGTGFPRRETTRVNQGGREPPPAGSFVLVVATIEVRKNHILLFRVWRRLIEALGAEAVPTLVFAGKIGWLVDDLMAQLRNADFLDGKVQIIEQPSDAELQRLYETCLFTLFPSLHEGWGLPVTESLGFGCPCVISNTTSLPEAGGALARYFDPENTAEAAAVIGEILGDRAGLERWRARVGREFTPVAWDASGRAILAAIGVDV